MITTQSGDYSLSVDAGAGADGITTVGAQLTSADTIDGGADTDTITLSADAATIVDADFTNIDNVEGFHAADGANSVTLGTKADDSGLATVTGGGGVDTINAAAFAGELTVGGAGADVITTQSGDYSLSVDAGAGADGITTVGAQLTSADTIDGGADTDTITLSADAATIVDADFDNISNVEKFTTADGANSVTLGTKADDSGLATVTGGGGVDTINAAAFAGALTVASGAGADVITTQSGDYNLSVDAGAGADGITTVGAQLTSADTIDGGADTDTITLSADAATIVDADFDNISNVEKFTTADGANSVTLGTKADDSGLATVTGGDDADTINAAAFAGALTVASGAGADVITTQSGDYSLSVDAGAGADGITTVGAQLTSADTIDGGADTDTITLSADAATIVDADFDNISNVEKFTTADGANSVTLGTGPMIRVLRQSQVAVVLTRLTPQHLPEH